jgi:hypothetical protein
VDGDVFGRVTKLGRAAADAVARAVSGKSWDPFHASRCLDTLITAAGGIPSLVNVIAEFAGLRSAPLLARLQIEGASQRIHEASRQPGYTELDLILRSTAERFLRRGEFAVRPMLEGFFRQLLDRAVLMGRAGFMEVYGPSQLEEARAMLAPVASAAAAALEARPTAKRLGLARAHADVTAETDLLGGE